MSAFKTITISIIVGTLIGAGAMSLLQPLSTDTTVNSTEAKKPLYWVAPMDSNYRRDGPGKSPMGMDLVPVYEEPVAENKHGPGTVEIAPHVVNNLGVRTANVELGVLHTQISTVGYVQYDEDNLIHIHPRVDGWIETLYVKTIGDPVKKGQPLYTLYSPELVNAQEELLLTLKSGEQSLINASKERLKALHITPEFITELVRTRNVKQNVTFYSPQAGVIDDLKIREGFYVQPGTTLFSIGKLDKVWVEAEIFERDTALVKAGQQVSMKMDYLPGKTWNGTVDYIYPTLNSMTRTLRVRLTFDNPHLELKPNMFAQVAIHADNNDEVITVPRESVIRTGQQDRVVLALGDGEFKSVAVDIGRVDKNRIEILKGLNEDDIIVTSAHFLIDSESSKSSDFMRMSNEKLPESVWVEGTINEVMTNNNMVNITHGPMEAWGMPGMIMNFEVTNQVDISTLKAGQKLHFEAIKLDSGMYAVNGVHIMSEPEGEDKNDNMSDSMKNMDHSMHQAEAEDKPVPAEIKGKINKVMSDARMLSISHGPIEAWNMPGMTMFFDVPEDIDMGQFKVGQSIHYQAIQTENGYLITMVHQPADKPQH